MFTDEIRQPLMPPAGHAAALHCIIHTSFFHAVSCLMLPRCLLAAVSCRPAFSASRPALRAAVLPRHDTLFTFRAASATIVCHATPAIDGPPSIFRLLHDDGIPLRRSAPPCRAMASQPLPPSRVRSRIAGHTAAHITMTRTSRLRHNTNTVTREPPDYQWYATAIRHHRLVSSHVTITTTTSRRYA